jgi:cysteine desulfurase
VALKEWVAISNGSACTSSSYSASHVLTAMGLQENEIAEAVRMSWCHLTPMVDWERVVEAVRSLR